MSMEVRSNYREYRNDYLERLQEGQNKVGEIESEKSSVLEDAYISSEKSDRRPSGLYRMGQDENGNPKVLFDDPKKSGSPGVKSQSADDDEEKCIGSTDQVDKEIEKLKEQKKQLEQQIRTASGDEEKVRELEKKLAQIEQELNQKDNDAYRRQHSTFSQVV